MIYNYRVACFRGLFDHCKRLLTEKFRYCPCVVCLYNDTTRNWNINGIGFGYRVQNCLSLRGSSYFVVLKETCASHPTKQCRTKGTEQKIRNGRPLERRNCCFRYASFLGFIHNSYYFNNHNYDDCKICILKMKKVFFLFSFFFPFFSFSFFSFFFLRG